MASREHFLTAMTHKAPKAVILELLECLKMPLKAPEKDQEVRLQTKLAAAAEVWMLSLIEMNGLVPVTLRS